MKRFGLVACSLIIMLFFCSKNPVSAQSKPLDLETAMSGKQEMQKELEEKLKLLPQQKEQLDANKKAHREKMKGLFQKMRTLKEEMRVILTNDILDIEKITQKHNELKAMMTQMMDMRLESILKVNEIMSKDQRKIMIHHFEEMRKNLQPASFSSFGDPESESHHHGKRHGWSSDASGTGNPPVDYLGF
ncbi:MAG: periplasmic heavy metal sensor [Candidatus Riflebacteria bacterium]|nr:periplasmic heavy metal sensor [Candidatus Riflebacteria bacterium]